MLQQLRTATLVLIAMTILTGGVYPLVVTIVAQVAFPRQANGSLIQQGEQITGSELIGQPFSRPVYFWGRLSATGPHPYNAAASSGSNFGPLHPGLKETAEDRILALHAAGSSGKVVPVDLVTASGSGLDPHISPAAAEFQVPRIAAARKMSEGAVRDLVSQYTEGRQLGILGESRVNVLRLNLALDQRQGN
ncbi:potassium-transporting ATPase, C subunit [Planctopirus limnophila DSM 3776]|uniref:Potassium-transporting ATPase KdpC subunit n=1 Tax=Planctopirus limnophila (strain ATCC 43296 / DSM 3776 / IFAM 1008 / Mu 290) TaxID=521674 RepID=D5SYH5_PLAL2|nr:potassium-transporting ATPase subunit KdpC [Planctopirus limnophila]ADG67703.1 potassium-transporting ATPase, C subunit [Planctopirus limnophila DSM 3776]